MTAPVSAPAGLHARLRAVIESPYKGETGLRRLVNATRNSLAGLVEAVRHEDAFRQELILAAIFLPLAFRVGDHAIERALLIGAVLLVLIVELLHSAVEPTGDRISFETAAPRASVPMTAPHELPNGYSGPALQAQNLTKRYGGLTANEGIDFSVNAGEVRGIIGPNGAGKTTFFRMLTCEVPPTAGQILFEGRDITGMTVTDVCQLGLTKSYQVNQLFNRLTVRENVAIAALAALRGEFKLDLVKNLRKVEGLDQRVGQTLELVNLGARRDTPVA